MKVILTQDVAKIGRRFDIVNVPDGYALNMLIPKGLARPGTPENIKSLEAQKSRVAHERQAEGEVFNEAAKQAQAMTLKVMVSVNEQGHMFEALKPETVAEFYQQNSVNLSPANLHFSTPIKEVGEHTITLQSGSEKVEAKIEVISK